MAVKQYFLIFLSLQVISRQRHTVFSTT